MGRGKEMDGRRLDSFVFFWVNRFWVGYLNFFRVWVILFKIGLFLN